MQLIRDMEASSGQRREPRSDQQPTSETARMLLN